MTWRHSLADAHTGFSLISASASVGFKLQIILILSVFIFLLVFFLLFLVLLISFFFFIFFLLYMRTRPCVWTGTAISLPLFVLLPVFLKLLLTKWLDLLWLCRYLLDFELAMDVKHDFSIIIHRKYIDKFMFLTYFIDKTSYLFQSIPWTPHFLVKVLQLYDQLLHALEICLQ